MKKITDENMANKLLAQISRDFFAKQNIYQYRMKKIKDMDDQSVVRCCHWYCEENNLTKEFKEYREESEAEVVTKNGNSQKI